MASGKSFDLKDVRPQWRIRPNPENPEDPKAKRKKRGNTSAPETPLESVVRQARAHNGAANAARPRHERGTTNPKKLRRMARAAFEEHLRRRADEIRREQDLAEQSLSERETAATAETATPSPSEGTPEGTP